MQGTVYTRAAEVVSPTHSIGGRSKSRKAGLISSGVPLETGTRVLSALENPVAI